MEARNLATSERDQPTGTNEQSKDSQPLNISGETFLTKGTAASLAAGVVGGTIAFVGTAEANPVLAVSGAALVASGGLYKAYNAWKTRSASGSSTPSVPIVPGKKK